MRLDVSSISAPFRLHLYDAYLKTSMSNDDKNLFKKTKLKFHTSCWLVIDVLISSTDTRGTPYDTPDAYLLKDPTNRKKQISSNAINRNSQRPCKWLAARLASEYNQWTCQMQYCLRDLEVAHVTQICSKVVCCSEITIITLKSCYIIPIHVEFTQVIYIHESRYMSGYYSVMHNYCSMPNNINN